MDQLPDTETILPRDTPFFEIVKQALTDAARRTMRVVPELDSVAFVTSWKGPLADAKGIPGAIIVSEGGPTTGQVTQLARGTISLLNQEIEFLNKHLPADGRMQEAAPSTEPATPQ